ncbi:dihydrofolate reductase family protein [Levilactobacillus parabrevis]|uniref:dihydrofolate reductase family protein n=1 Tax=Levilactobacillus parabrevis TaxID=357278 RepID=UPI003756F152
MGKIQFYGAISLDGYLATTDDNIDWLTRLPNIPADVGADTLAAMSSAILGRVTYEAVQAMAPGSPLNPHNPAMVSYVLSHQARPSQPGYTFTSTDVVTLATQLAQQSGNVWIVGGSGVLTPLLAANLVDDLYIQIAPILLGTGKRLFGELTQPQNYQLVTTHQYGPLAEVVYHRVN